MYSGLLTAEIIIHKHSLSNNSVQQEEQKIFIAGKLGKAGIKKQ